MSTAYDVVVIGAGAAGLTAATEAARLGANVALVERSRYLGGECPNTACVPTQTLLRAAKTYHTLLHADQLGLPTISSRVQYRQLKAFKDSIVAQTAGRHLTAARLKEQGVTLHSGVARFTDHHTLAVGNERIASRQFVIATGTSPCPPSGLGLEQVSYLTHREAIELTEAPSSLFILGGGPIGVEFAQFFAIFGVDVTLVEYGPRLLPNEDGELSSFVLNELKGFGITVLTDFHAEQITAGTEGVEVRGTQHGQRRTAAAQQLLIACGNRPNIEKLGLDALGVRVTDNGIQTDQYLRTTAPHVWAIGDVTSNPHYTHTAHYQGSLVAQNVTQANKQILDFRVVPRALATFTDIASVGKTEQQLLEANRPVVVGRSDISQLGRALIDQTQAGYIKILCDPTSGQILGASMAVPQAHELIHEIAAIMKAKAPVETLASLLHAYPTYAEGIAVAAADAAYQRATL